MAGTSQTLHIGRVRTEYILSSEHPSPDSVRTRLDEAVNKGLPGVLSRFLSHLFSEADPSIWLIRKLELDVHLNAAWDRDQVTKHWAMEITRSMVRELQGGGDGRNSMRFEDRSAYLAAFLTDTAEGCAWSKWYYGQFDGLRMLPVSAALRTAVGGESETGMNALLRLSSRDLKTVINALHAQDARRVLLSISGGGGGEDPKACLGSLNTALEKEEWAELSFDPEWNGALHLYLAACREQGSIPGPVLQKTALAVIRLARLLQAASAGGKENILNALIARDPAVLRSCIRTQGEILTPLADAPSDLVGHTLALLGRRLGENAVSAASGRPVVPEMRETFFGGIFLLLPFLAELPLEEANSAWPKDEEVPAGPALRLLILSKCFGPAGSYRVFSDPLTRDLLGVPPSVAVSSIMKWQKGLARRHIDGLERAIKTAGEDAGNHKAETADNELRYLSLPKPFVLSSFLDNVLSIAARNLLHSFSRRLPGFSSSSAEYLCRNFLEFSATLEEGPSRRIVRINRPPLNLVLNMTGMTRQTYLLPWLDERPLALFQEG